MMALLSILESVWRKEEGKSMQKVCRAKLIGRRLGKKRIAIITSLIAVVIAVAGIAAYRRNPDELTFEQAAEIAHTYFSRVHRMFIGVKGVSYERVAQRDYRNFITVFHGHTEYTLILDKRNKPASDNVLAVDTMNSIDISSFDGRLRELGLERHEHYDLETILSTDFQYEVVFSVVCEGRPNKDAKDGIYSFLNELKKEGVDRFIININTPSFLRPKLRYGHGTHGLRLIELGVDTDIDAEAFEEKYYTFTDQLYWNKQKFDDMIKELTNIGYENAYFFVSRGVTGNTLEIVLYCESEGSLSDESALALLEKVDETYFKVGDAKIKYTLQHRQT